MKFPVKFTPYVIRRDHGNKTGFFWCDTQVCCAIVQIGPGFQLRVGPYVIGCSLTWLARQ